MGRRGGGRGRGLLLLGGCRGLRRLLGFGVAFWCVRSDVGCMSCLDGSSIVKNGDGVSWHTLNLSNVINDIVVPCVCIQV